MFHNSCVRITTSALLMAGSLTLAACSSSEPQSSQVADSPSPPAAVQTTPPPEQTGTPAVAAENAPTPSPNVPSTSPSSAPGTAAMKMFVDPVTGEVRDPTPAERAAMAKQQSESRATEKPRQRETKLRNGGTAITIEGGPETPLQGCVGPDGGLTVDHNCADVKQPKQDPKGE